MHGSGQEEIKKAGFDRAVTLISDPLSDHFFQPPSAPLGFPHSQVPSASNALAGSGPFPPHVGALAEELDMSSEDDNAATSGVPSGLELMGF